MATYVNDLRLKEIGTGESSGTWGTETNVNLELIGESMGYGTEAVANASTHTITMADGVADGFRCTFLRLTGGGQACTVTLAPNTLSHTWIIRNTTSYALTFTQGSGANVIIAAGLAKMVTTDGLGSGAVVYECLEDLELGGTLTVGIDDTGQDVKFFGATSGKYWLWDESADGVVQQGTLTIGVDDTGYDVKLFGATSGAYMLWDESADDLKLVGAAGLTVAGDIDVDGTSNLDIVDIDGAVDMASTLQVDGVITTADGMVITTADNTDTLSLISTDTDANSGPHLRLYRNSASPADSDDIGSIRFDMRNDNSQDFIAVQINGDCGDVSDGTEDAEVKFNIMTAGTLREYLRLASGSNPAVIINNDSQDINFQVQSDGNANMLFVDAGNDRVGIGTASPATPLHVSRADDGKILRLTRGGIGDWDFSIGNTPTLPGVGTGALEIFPTVGNSYFAVGIAGGGTTLLHVKNTGIYVVAGLEATPAYSFTADTNTGMYSAAADALGFCTGGAERLRIDSSGTFTVGDTSAASGSNSCASISSGGTISTSRAATNAQTHHSFLNPNGTVGSITTNGSATAYNTSSDYRLKENVDYSWDATTRLKQLKPARFNWIVDETNTLLEGFLAHEVSPIVPEAVSGAKDAMTTEVLYVEGDELPEDKSIGDVKTATAPDYQGIDQSKLVPLLVKTIQELEARITALEE